MKFKSIFKTIRLNLFLKNFDVLNIYTNSGRILGVGFRSNKSYVKFEQSRYVRS